jgi:AcrR family transcriptional regulator
MSEKPEPRPRTKPAQERRDELMNAAERLFLEHGIASTTIEQITTAAEVAKGTFYLYFTSKEDICAALGDRFAGQLLGTIQAAVARKRSDDWKGRLAEWASAAAAGYLDAIRLHDILFYSVRPPTREGLVDNIVIDHLTELLAAGVESGAWTLDDPRFTAVFLFSGLHAAVDDAYVRQRPVNRKLLVDRLQRLYLRAVTL